MNGTHVREVGGDGPVSPLPDLAGMGRSERIHALRSRMSAMGAAVPQLREEHDPQPESPPTQEDILPAPEVLSGFLPGEGFPRRAVTLFPDQPLLVVELLAHVTARGGYAAIIGWREFAYAGVVESGGVCENIIVIPDPGPQPLNVAAVLCEGLDLVVYHGAETTLSPTRARPLLGKLRRGTAALIMVGTGVPSPAVTVDARITNYLGIGTGQGRIRGVEMRISITARGHAPAGGTVVLGERGHHSGPHRGPRVV